MLPVWVMPVEYKHEFLETSFYMAPNGYLGAFSAAFTYKALDLLVEAGKRGQLNIVKRKDE